MLHTTNPYVKKFEQVKNFTVDCPEVEVMIRINGDLNRTGWHWFSVFMIFRGFFWGSVSMIFSINCFRHRMRKHIIYFHSKFSFQIRIATTLRLWMRWQP